MRSIVIFAGIALAAGFLGPRYASHIGTDVEPATLSAHPLTPVVTAASGSRSVIVPRDSRGQFEVDAIVNGRRVGFMVDTGASVVALTAHDAARLGFVRRRMLSSPRSGLQTARFARRRPVSTLSRWVPSKSGTSRPWCCRMRL